MSTPAPSRPIHYQAARFALLSAVSFVLHLGLTVALHEGAGLTSYAAVPIAMAVITLMNFCMCRRFVFDRGGRSWWADFTGYIWTVVGFRVADYAAYLLLHGLIGLPYLPAYAAVLALSMVGKFLFLRGLIFPGHPAALAPGEPTT